MLKCLGYLGVAATTLDDWQGFATTLLGLQCTLSSKTTLSLRLDDLQQRIVVDTALAPGQHFFGWQAHDAASVERLATKLDAAGVAIRCESAAVAERRAVETLISFQDPAGNRVEVFHGPTVAAAPFRPSRSIAGFRTGALGLGHVVLTDSDLGPLLAFYRDLLGFGLSDFMLSPFPAYFLHLNARHHSLALIGSDRRGLHHLMVELVSFDDVGQAYDIALAQEDRIGVSLGRHSNDLMTSFYAKSPSGFMVEYGWGGRDIQTHNWQPIEFFHGASLWGHERYWLPAEKRQEALRMRLKAAADGFKAPVQVLDGQYTIVQNN